MSTPEKQQVKWYFKTSTLVVLFLSIGPFALPLLWLNPRFSKSSKMIVSAIVIILTCVLGFVMINSVKTIITFYRQIDTGIF